MTPPSIYSFISKPVKKILRQFTDIYFDDFTNHQMFASESWYIVDLIYVGEWRPKPVYDFAEDYPFIFKNVFSIRIGKVAIRGSWHQ